MRRLLIADLLDWKQKKSRKPLLLKGARQVGKTWLLKTFGKEAFSKVHYINFERTPALETLFREDLSPHRILGDLGAALGTQIHIGSDLLILDEIQAAPRALTSLKYFKEDLPELALASAGSLLGVKLQETASFPVGSVDFLDLRPMSFQEFLLAFDLEGVLNPTPPPHLQGLLWRAFKAYLITGGLPEAVSTFVSSLSHAAQARTFELTAPAATFEAVREVQYGLMDSYLADMAKHSGKLNSMHLERILRSIPSQLGRDLDTGTRKYQFKGVIPGLNKYSQFVHALDWLEAAGLVHKVHICHNGEPPLQAYIKESAFKLFSFDIGMLGVFAGLAPAAIWGYDFGTFKGYLAENFVLQELIAGGMHPLFCWQEGTAEVEFITDQSGRAIPIEVKAGKSTRAKSLRVYREKYSPQDWYLLSAQDEQSNSTKGQAGEHWVHLPAASWIAQSIRSSQDAHE